MARIELDPALRNQPARGGIAFGEAEQAREIRGGRFFHGVEPVKPARDSRGQGKIALQLGRQRRIVVAANVSARLGMGQGFFLRTLGRNNLHRRLHARIANRLSAQREANRQTQPGRNEQNERIENDFLHGADFPGFWMAN